MLPLEEDSAAVELDGLLVDAAALVFCAEELLLGALLLLMVELTLMLVEEGALLGPLEEDRAPWVDVAVAVEDDSPAIPELPLVVMRWPVVQRPSLHTMVPAQSPSTLQGRTHWLPSRVSPSLHWVHPGNTTNQATVHNTAAARNKVATMWPIQPC